MLHFQGDKHVQHYNGITGSLGCKWFNLVKRSLQKMCSSVPKWLS